MPKQVSPKFLELNTTHCPSAQSPKWASISLSVVIQTLRLPRHSDSALLWAPEVLSLQPADGEGKGVELWRVTWEFLRSSCGKDIHHFHSHPTIRTQSTPNCRGVWQWNPPVTQGIGEDIDVSTQTQGHFLSRSARARGN